MWSSGETLHFIPFSTHWNSLQFSVFISHVFPTWKLAGLSEQDLSVSYNMRSAVGSVLQFLVLVKKKQCLLEWSFQFSSIFLLEQALTMRFVLLPNNSETRIQNSLGVYVNRINREDKESHSRSIDAYCWKDPAEVLLECYDDVSWTLEGFQEYRYAGEISYVILYFRLILWFIEAAGM